MLLNMSSRQKFEYINIYADLACSGEVTNDIPGETGLALTKSMEVPRLLRLDGVEYIHVDREQQFSEGFLVQLLLDWS